MAMVPGRENVVEAVAWWEAQLAALDVDVRTGTARRPNSCAPRHPM